MKKCQFAGLLVKNVVINRSTCLTYSQLSWAEVQKRLLKTKNALGSKLGLNPSSVDSVVVGKGSEVKMKPGQKLHIVNQLYPYTIQFKEDSSGHHSGTKRSRELGSEDRESQRECPSVKAVKQEGSVSSDSHEDVTSTTAPAGHWSQGLKASMQDPKMQVYKDEKVVVIKDKYPKAHYHWLVLPWKSISSLKDLCEEHCDLLKHMQHVADQMVQQCPDAGSVRFRTGYHAIPSMSHIHLHVISQDFDSPCLKNKKHWNSFTTDYFIDSKDVLEMLETSGRVSVKEGASEMLKLQLRCHVCRKEFPTMPGLKEHLKSHLPK
ncbi:aprataxin isoform X2 [Thalassophryne amazonica]|uniref:aprataxin isoform X2 n=1 Tax=Thalassophryne amazonica TaxID=390379 RepID=UPI001471EB16|nr:aprataxin isoform X2 [Thalassophryne amazonica]